MKLKLSNGGYALIDRVDLDRIKHLKWSRGWMGKNYVGANIPKRFSCRDDGIWDKIILHRFIINAPKGFHVDHINGNPLDNRRKNLRVCTPAQNQFNSRKKSKATSKFKGVSWFKRDGCWRAYISKDWKQIHIGYFRNEISAAKAYNRIAKNIFGKFAFLNKV